MSAYSLHEPTSPHGFSCAPLREVLHTIAGTVLGGDAGAERVGDVTLHAHQRHAAARLSDILACERGAMLLDAVGLGKTYTALAVAATRGSLLVIAPAALRTMWSDALARTGLAGKFISFEALSRGRIAGDHHTMVIIDEAHHARNPAARRYDGVARACARAGVLLLSATPVHNSRADLAALLALFLGSRAYELTDEEVARFIVRRTSVQDVAGVPRVVSRAPVRLIRDEATLDALLALPPPIPPRDGELPARLVTAGLVRQWVSSTAALAAALRRRLAHGEALLAALAAGRYPSAHELRAWSYAEDSLQLAFPELLAPSAGEAAELAPVVDAHASGVRALLRALGPDDTDDRRAAYVREIRRAHPNERIVAFTTYAETARALHRTLRSDGRVALLTARGGLVAGGTLTRDEVLARFAPNASGAAPPRDAESITLLIATDLLSEGVNLQDASVCIHLDLPWTDARLEQRVGRIARIGSAHSVVTSYTIEPPPRADAWLRAQELLVTKRAAAARTIGGVRGRPEGAPASPVSHAERIRELLRSAWGASPCRDGRSPPLVAAAQHDSVDECIALAAITRGTTPSLVAVREDATVLTSFAALEPVVVAALAGEAADVDSRRVVQTLGALQRWSDERRAAVAAGVAECAPGVAGGPAPTRARQSALRSAGTLANGGRYARRAALAELAARVRHAALHAIPIAIEREVRALSLGSFTDQDAARLAELVSGLDERTIRPGSGALRIAALVLLSRPVPRRRDR